jgi:hypothetical protein
VKEYMSNYGTRNMHQGEWENRVKEHMSNAGWTCDRDDEKTLGFFFIEGDHHWIRDYDKKERRFVQFDGNQRVNLIMRKE